MTEENPFTTEEEIDLLSFEAKIGRLDDLLKKLDDSATPVDQLAEDVKAGCKIIRDLDRKLTEVESQVRYAFQELEESRKEPWE